MAIACPECDNPLTVDPNEVEEGDTLHCDECGTESEVVSVDPLEIARVDDAGYDEEDHGLSGNEEEE